MVLSEICVRIVAQATAGVLRWRKQALPGTEARQAQSLGQHDKW